MGKKSNAHQSKHGENIFAAISVGTILILIGLIFVVTPNLFGAIVEFFKDFGMVEVDSGTGFVLPAPVSPWKHTTVYQAWAQFSLGIGFLYVVLLALRVNANSSIIKTAEMTSNLVFWFGASYLVSTHLNSNTTHRLWFAFWAGIIALVGVSFVVRAIILFARSRSII
ncbi:hypothetical protein KAI12_02205 [Candidatus Bathyarchaeota archaeon]|nr:hypothetical protein [Candidatus Bathyarchaeota archaeon]